MSNREDRSLLEDMLESLHRIEQFVQGLDYQAFLEDCKTQDAVVRNLEILGEATKLLNDSIKSRHPDIPWTHMARLRDRLIHHYFGINLDIVWDIIQTELPPLAKQIQEILNDTP